MTTFSPMTACGPCVGPEILLIFVPWLVGIVVGFINLVVVCWRMSEPSAGFRDPALFLGCLGLALAFIRGVFGSPDDGMWKVLFFVIPALPIAHSVYMFCSWRKERKLKRQNDAANALQAIEGRKI
jgi:hypothetical protein